MRWLRTLRGRITLAAAAAILAAVVVFAVVTVLLVDHELRESLNSALRQRALTVASLAVSAPAVLDDPGTLEGTASGRQLAVEVLDSRGRLLARSLALGAQLLPGGGVVRAARLHGRPGFADVTVGGRAMRVYAAPIADAGGPAAGGVVLVAADTGDIVHTTHALAVAVIIAGAIVVALAAVAAAILTRRSLRPLHRLVTAAGEIERTADVSRRLPEVATADEVGQLTGVLNRMLSSLEHARVSERRFLADASHELRTPVTALMGNVEYAARHGADPEVLADLRVDAERLARLVDSLLALERAGEAAPAFEPVALDEVVRSVAGERVVLGQVQPATVQGDPAALRRAVGNLVENGLVHGPPGGRVTVGVSVSSDAAQTERAGLTGPGGWALVSVSDEGPGPDMSVPERLFERFWRADSASERPGAGLGLSIVAAIAQAHGGRVDVRGSRFTLELPVSDGSAR